MLFRSLLLDLTSALKSARELSRQRAELVEFANRLALVVDQEASVLLAEVEKELIRNRAENPSGLLLRASMFLDAQAAEAAYSARRNTVLKALESLGYEVRDGMETAWIKNGRVVLKRASNSTYGVEIAGSGERVQVRTVAFENAKRTLDQDRKAETEWCSEIDAIREFARGRGADISIEKAVPVGAVPLKVLQVEEEDNADRNINQIKRPL